MHACIQLTVNSISISFFRAFSLKWLTVGQTKAEYRDAKPEEARDKKDKEPTPHPDRLILVSGQNADVPVEERQLPSHTKLSDG